MGWKASVIIVKDGAGVDTQAVLNAIDAHKHVNTEGKLFGRTIYPKDDSAYIGRYKGHLIICTADAPMEIIEKKGSSAESNLIKLFPQNEICAIILHSTVNLWGFAVIQNGKKVRARAGSSEDGTFINTGEPLEQEKQLLSKAVKDKDGNVAYILEEGEEPYNEDQVGENFVFSIWERYFEIPLDYTNEELDSLEMESYVSIKTAKAIAAKTNTTDANTKPWWKFW